jgi:hypothetical protein
MSLHREVHPGMLYGECWPSGAQVVSPPNLRFLRVSRGWQTAGQDDAGRIVSHEGRVLLETSCGVSPVIWVGETLVSNVDCQHGTQGYRYVRPDGTIATGDETYKHPTLPLWEYTDLGDGLLIGQGEDGAVVWDGTMMRLLEPGHCTFIRANREGDRVGIAIAKQQDGPSCVTFVCDMAELRALPPVTAPTPPPQLDPEPEPMPTIPNHFHVVQAMNRAYPDLIAANTMDTVKEFMWRTVWALYLHDAHWGFLSKSPAEHGMELAGVGRVSVDAIAYKGAEPVVDILSSAGDGPGTGGITWGVDEHRRPSNLWMQPVPFPNGAPPPDPPDVPPVPPGQPTPTRDEFNALKRYAESLAGHLQRVEKTADDAWAGADEALVKAKRALAVANSVSVILGKLKIKGSTSRAYGHAHTIELPVEPKE